MKKVRYSYHALGQMQERGVTEREVEESLLKGERVPAKKGRHAYRLNFQYNQNWFGKIYAMKQVLSIVKEEDNQIVVITVYVFYF